MEKRRINCFKEYIQYKGIYNNEIYHYIGGGWNSSSLAICTNCGELFIFDQQALFSKNFTLQDVTIGICCPNCNSSLNATIEIYPDTFKMRNGELGHFSKPSYVSADKEIKVIEVWELDL